jgi:hypothetical protein
MVKLRVASRQRQKYTQLDPNYFYNIFNVHQKGRFFRSLRYHPSVRILNIILVYSCFNLLY